MRVRAFEADGSLVNTLRVTNALAQGVTRRGRDGNEARASIHMPVARFKLSDPNASCTYASCVFVCVRTGHSIPALKGPQLAVLRSFLVAAAGDAEELRVDAAAARAAAAAAAEAGGIVARTTPAQPGGVQAQAGVPAIRQEERDMGPAEGGEEDDDGGQGGGKAPIRREGRLEGEEARQRQQEQGRGQERQAGAGVESVGRGKMVEPRSRL